MYCDAENCLEDGRKLKLSNLFASEVIFKDLQQRNSQVRVNRSCIVCALYVIH